MSMDIIVKKGLDLKLVGKPSNEIEQAKFSQDFAVYPADFHGVFPKLVVKENDSVKAGDILFFDKNKQKIYDLKNEEKLSAEIKQWLAFADEKVIENVKQEPFTKKMINNFFSQARKSYAEGLASLYTYERQIPEIAETKIQGLKKFYGVSSKEGLEFFEAHKSADVIHRAECEKLLDGLSKEEQEKAETASLLTARYLWNFLSGMTTKHKLRIAA
mgnify:CR=1 FL=1